MPELDVAAFQTFRKVAFEEVKRGLQASDLRFAYEQVDVLGHEDTAVNVEAVSLTALFKEWFETDAGRVIVEIGKAVVTTEGEEVQMVSC